MEVGNLMARLGLDMTNFNAGLEKARSSLQNMDSKMKDLGGKMSMGLTAPLMAGLGLVTEGTKEFSSDLARLETNANMAGANMDQMTAAMAELEGVTGETDSNVEGLSNILAAGFKGDKFQSVMEGLAGAAIKFSDTLKFEGLADGLQETLATGAAIGPFAELLDRSGISLDTFNAGLKEAAANGTQEQYVLDTLAKAGLPAVYAEYQKNNGAMMDNAAAHFELTRALSELGATLMPIVTTAMTKLSELVKGFNGLSEGTQKAIIIMAGFAAGIGPALAIIGNLITVAKALGVAFTFITGPVGIVIAIFAVLVAAGVLIYKNWDEIKAKGIQIWNSLKDSLTKTVEAIKQSFAKAWEAMKADASKTWDGIKQFFSSWWASLKASFASAISTVNSALSTGWNTAKTVALSIFNGIKSGIMSIWSAISGGVSGAVAGVVGVIRGGLEGAWSYIKGIAGQAVSWGANIIRGLMDGIKSMAASAVNAALDVANSIKSGVKNALGIHSPSKVMDEFGQMITQGLADGIETRTNKVKEKMEKVSNIIKSVADTMVNGLDRALELSAMKLDLSLRSLGENATESQKLTIELQKLQLEKENLAQKIEVLIAAYEKSKQQTGVNSQATKDYAYEVEKAKLELQALEIDINNTTKALRKNSPAVENLNKSLEEMDYRLEELDAKQQIERARLEDSEDGTRGYRLEVEQGIERLELLGERISIINDLYQTQKAATGANSTATRELYLQLQNTIAEFEDLKSSVRDNVDQYEEAKGSLKGIRDQLQALDGITVDAYVNTHVNDGSVEERNERMMETARNSAPSGVIGTDEEGNQFGSNWYGTQDNTGYWNNFGEFIKLATGGIVTRPTFAMVGEAGPEAVIPLDKLGNVGNSQQPIELIVNLDSRVISQQLYYLQQGQFRGGGLR